MELGILCTSFEILVMGILHLRGGVSQVLWRLLLLLFG